MTMEGFFNIWENHIFFTLSVPSKIYGRKHGKQYLTICNWIPHPILILVIHKYQEPQ